jgi:membrane dipeptidase
VRGEYALATMKRAVRLVAVAVLAACGGGAPVEALSPPAPPPAREPVAVPAATPAPVPTAPPPPLTLEERAARLHSSAIVVDTHDDITSAILEDGFDLAHPNGKTQTDLPRMRAGGVTAEFFSIYVDARFYEHPSSREGGGARRALDMIDITYQQIERHPQDLVLATSADDIRHAKQDGTIAVLMGIEGGYAIEDSLHALRDFYRLGVRYMTLTHATNNDWADSSGIGTAAPPRPRHHGLSAFGEEVVREMQRVGMLVDVSHVSDETIEAVLRIATAPVIASHSSARALCDAPRNLSDEELRGIAATGGVVMVNFFSGYLDPGYRTAMHAFFTRHGAELAALDKKGTKLSALREAALKMGAGDLPKVPLGVLIDHIEHIAKVAGVDHVGLGSDFDGVESMPEGLQGIDGLPRITLELLRRGWSDEDVKKVLGENFLRAFAAAEAHARSSKTTLSGDGSTKRLD